MARLRRMRTRLRQRQWLRLGSPAHADWNHRDLRLGLDRKRDLDRRPIALGARGDAWDAVLSHDAEPRLLGGELAHDAGRALADLPDALAGHARILELG